MSAMNIGQKEFRDMIQEGTEFLVDYWAPWCGYCRRIGPAYDKVAQQYEGRLPVVKINIDEEGALAQEQKIEVIPTLILYRQGEAVASLVAPESKAAIDTFLREHLAK